MVDPYTCEHEWENLETEESFETSTCMHCGAFRIVDTVRHAQSISIELEDGQIDQDGNLHCGACGMLAAPGDEHYDWCNHRTGEGCPYMYDEDDDDDEINNDWDEDDADDPYMENDGFDFDPDIQIIPETFTEWIGDDFDDDDAETT